MIHTAVENWWVGFVKLTADSIPAFRVPQLSNRAVARLIANDVVADGWDKIHAIVQDYQHEVLDFVGNRLEGVPVVGVEKFVGDFVLRSLHIFVLDG